MNKIQPKTLSGFMELLPKDQILFNNMLNIIKTNYEKYGFLPLDTPVMESSEVLLAKAGGETEKQIYEIKKGDNNLCLRFDLTVPLAKYVALYQNELAFPFRRYQIAKVYRGERPQKGRFREFYQCDIDIIGRDKLSTKCDAEIPSIIYNIFKQLNVGDFEIRLSNRKLLLGLMEEYNLKQQTADVLRIIDKYEKIGKQNVKECLINDLKLNTTLVDNIFNFIEISGTTDSQIKNLKKLSINNATFNMGIEELEEVVNYMTLFGVSKNNFKIDLTIARGLDYYTGTVYETFLKGYESIGSVCSGGRFDDLASYYTDKKFPGVGMSIGLTRLFYKLKENNVISRGKTSVSDVIVLSMGDYYKECAELVTKLRECDIKSEMYFEDTKFKNKMAYASALDIPYVIIIGEDEIKNNYVSIKDMRTSTQQSLSINQAIKLIKG